MGCRVVRFISFDELRKGERKERKKSLHKKLILKRLTNDSPLASVELFIDSINQHYSPKNSSSYLTIFVSSNLLHNI